VIGMAAPAEAIAFAALSGTRIDALVTDVVMPGMSGPDLARTLLAGHPHLRRVFMSGYADRPLGDEDAQFIGKPFAMDDLALKVRAALDTP
jgi:FixJ family two-component response regulator